MKYFLFDVSISPLKEDIIMTTAAAAPFWIVSEMHTEIRPIRDNRHQMKVLTLSLDWGIHRIDFVFPETDNPCEITDNNITVIYFKEHEPENSIETTLDKLVLPPEENFPPFYEFRVYPRICNMGDGHSILNAAMRMVKGYGYDRGICAVPVTNSAEIALEMMEYIVNAMDFSARRTIVKNAVDCY